MSSLRSATLLQWAALPFCSLGHWAPCSWHHRQLARQHWSWGVWDISFLVNLLLTSLSHSISAALCVKTGAHCFVLRICVCQSWWAHLVYTDLPVYLLFIWSLIVSSFLIGLVSTQSGRWVDQPLDPQHTLGGDTFQERNGGAPLQLKVAPLPCRSWCDHKGLGLDSYSSSEVTLL